MRRNKRQTPAKIQAKQDLFCDLYFNPRNKETFGNAYKSALSAGYTESYAKIITAPAINNTWIQEYRDRIDFGPEHIKQGIQDIAVKGGRDSDRLTAYKLLAQLQGLLVDRNITAHVSIEDAISQLK